jgi:hypothetical protein
MIFTDERKRRGIKPLEQAMRLHTWGAIGGAAISVVGGAIASNKAKKKAGQEVPFTPVDLQQEQRDALAGNLASQNSIEQLLARSNQFQQGQALSLAEQAMPGFGSLTRTLSDRATTLAENPYDVPKGVEDNLARIAAERGISAGTRGEFNDFSLLRDFGVNQLQYGRENLSQASQITNLLSSIAPRVNPMSPLAFYVTPQQNAANTTTNNQTTQSVSQSGTNAAAAAANANNATWANLINGATGLGASIFTNSANNRAARQPTGTGIDLSGTMFGA